MFAHFWMLALAFLFGIFYIVSLIILCLTFFPASLLFLICGKYLLVSRVWISFSLCIYLRSIELTMYYFISTVCKALIASSCLIQARYPTKEISHPIFGEKCLLVPWNLLHQLFSAMKNLAVPFFLSSFAMIYDNSKRDHFRSEVLNIIQHLPKINATWDPKRPCSQSGWEILIKHPAGYK